MKILTKLLTTLFSLCLMFSVILICLVMSLSVFFKSDIYIEALTETNAYEEIQQSIQNNLDDMMLLNNIETSTLNDLITTDEVKAIVNQDVNSIINWLNNKNSTIETLNLSIYEARFDERMNTFFRDYQYFLDESAKKDVEVMKQNALQFIEGYVRLLDFEKLTQTPLLQMIPKLISYLNLVIVGLVLLTFIFIGINVALSPRSQSSRKKIEEGFLWSGYGILAGGLMVFVVFFSGVQSKFYEHTAIHLTYLKQLLAFLIKHGLTTLYVSGLIAASLGMILMLPYWTMLYKKYITTES